MVRCPGRRRAGATAAVTWTAAPTANGTYAALGDSYSSGEGAFDYYPDSDNPATFDTCHRSRHAYGPSLVTPAKLGTISFKACSGAVTDDIFSTNVANPNEPAQLTWLTPDTKTITLGGNDADFVKVMTRCVNGFRGFFPPEEVQGRWGCDSNTARRRNVSNRLSAFAGRPTGDIIVGRPNHPLLDVYKALHAKAPNAKIYVGGYSLLFGMNANRYQRNSLAPSRLVCPVGNLGLLPYMVDYRDALFIDTLALRLDNTIMETVRNAKAAGISITYVAPKRFDGHGLCDNKEPWIHGADIVDNKPAPSSFHPTRDGQQSGYTRDFLAVIGRR